MISHEQLTKMGDEEAQRLIKLYDIAETEIISQINKGLLKKKDSNYTKTILKNVQSILQQLLDGSRQWTQEVIPLCFTEAGKLADLQIATLGGTALQTGFGSISQQAMQVLAENTYSRFTEVVQVIGRQTNDLFRDMQLESMRGTVAGYDTWQEAAQKLRDNLAERGVTGFVDKAKHKWNMGSYCEMASRTVTMEAHNKGFEMRSLENGYDLVIISTHDNACELCEPWQGKILSLTGKTAGYPSVDEAKDAGLWHPRCRHAQSVYIPELNE